VGGGGTSWQEHQDWGLYATWPQYASSLHRQFAGYILTPFSEILKMEAAFSYETLSSIYAVHMFSVQKISLQYSPLWEPEKSWTCDLGFKTYDYTCRFTTVGLQMACPSGCAVNSVGLRPLSCRNCRLDLHRGHWCLSVVNVVCCSVEVNATGRSFVQGIATECMCVCVCHWVWSGTTITPYTLNDWVELARLRKKERKLIMHMVVPRQAYSFKVICKDSCTCW